MRIIANTLLMTAAPFTQLILMIGAWIGAGQSLTFWDWVLGSFVPFYGWYFVLFG